MKDRQRAVSLGLLAALYVVALVFLAPALDSFPDGAATDALLMFSGGLLFASPPLLAIWAVHGETRTLKRLLLTTWLFIIFFLAGAYGQVRNYGCGDLGVILMAAVGWATPYIAVVMALSLLRLVRGWRLSAGGEPAADGTAPSPGARAKQFTIRNLLIWTAAAAVPCAGIRWLAPYGSFETDWLTDLSSLGGVLFQGALMGILITLAGLPVLGVAWVVLADGRRPIWRLALVALTIGGILGGAALFGHWTGDNDEELVTLARMVELSVVVAALAAVSAMRLCGYRLVRPARVAEFARNPDVAQSHDPTGPEVGYGPISHPRWRLRLALAAFTVIALALTGYAPFRLHTWRRADEVQRWIRLGWNAEFDGEGRVVALTRNPDWDLAGSELSLSDLTDLRSLDFSHSHLTDAQLLQYSIQCPSSAHLESLDLTGTWITDEALSHVGRFTDIKELCLSGTKVTDSGLSQLGALKELKRLDVSDTAVALKQAPSLPPLESLNPEGTHIHDAELANLAAFPQLKTLVLVRTNVTDAGLDKLGVLAGLTMLDLSATDVTDEAAASLAQLTQLRSLNLELTAVSEAGFAVLQKALRDTNIQIGASDAMLNRIAHAQTIIKRGSSIGLAVSRTPRTLKRLHARGNYATRERDGNMVIAGAKTVTDAGLNALAGQTAMEELDLRDSGVTDAGLSLLTTLTGLKRLDLRGTAVTPSGRDTLAKALPGCEVLR